MEPVYEGKAKVLYDDGVPGTLLQRFKDDATANNAEKRGEFAGKGELNRAISHILMDAVAAAGVPTHFVENIDTDTDRVRRVEIIMLEVVMRNVAAGSFCRRFGAAKGMAFDPPLFEFYLKDDALGDPQISPEASLAMGLATTEEMAVLERHSRTVNTTLQALFAGLGLFLVDFKLEFGRTEQGEVILADEISPDTMRLWDPQTRESFDKDLFREDKGDLLAGYREVLSRLRAGAAK